jgi:hypothetical protein
MELLWTGQPQAWRYTLSLHYTFGGQNATLQASLSGRYDYTDWAVPVSDSVVSFTEYTTTDGQSVDLLGEQGIVSTFTANNLTEVRGLLMADNCYAEAIINFFA